MSADDEMILLATRKFRVVKTKRSDGTEKEIVRHPGAVVIIPLVSSQEVCLIRNYRVSVAQTLIELPAGTLEPGEPPLETARRELIEETGYRCGTIRHLHSFFLSPGILDEEMHLFVADQLALGPAAREPGEVIENLVVPWSEAMRMVVAGEIHDAKTMVGLLLWNQLQHHSGG